MNYTICEYAGERFVPIKDENGQTYLFNSSLEANEERCYLQVDYVNHLFVIEV